MNVQELIGTARAMVAATRGCWRWMKVILTETNDISDAWREEEKEFVIARVSKMN